MVDDFVNPPNPDLVSPDPDPVLPNTEFTEDEQEGFYILRAILSSFVDPARVTYKDTESYCNILLDGNTWKPIVRLHFNNPKLKKLEIFALDSEGNKISEKVQISQVNEIYKYSNRITSITSHYLEPKAIK